MITELEKMERAKMYIDKMAEGINPITNTYAPENDTINNDRIARCLSYVSEILGRVIENGGEVSRAVKSSGGNRNFFFITDEQLDRLSPRENSCYANDIADDIKAVTAENNTTKFQGTWITEWLVSIGMLMQTEKGKCATEAGESIGVISQLRQSIQKGEHFVNMYSPEAQQFIFDNISAVIEFHYTK